MLSGSNKKIECPSQSTVCGSRKIHWFFLTEDLLLDALRSMWSGHAWCFAPEFGSSMYFRHLSWDAFVAMPKNWGQSVDVWEANDRNKAGLLPQSFCRFTSHCLFEWLYWEAVFGCWSKCPMHCLHDSESKIISCHFHQEHSHARSLKWIPEALTALAPYAVAASTCKSSPPHEVFGLNGPRCSKWKLLKATCNTWLAQICLRSNLSLHFWYGIGDYRLQGLYFDTARIWLGDEICSKLLKIRCSSWEALLSRLLN